MEYKIILSAKSFYKEIEVSNEIENMKIGTEINCDVRLHKHYFFEPIEIFLTKVDSSFVLHCSENLYFSVDDVSKLLTKSLVHGDIIKVKYNNYDTDVFELDFSINFECKIKEYTRALDVSSLGQINIGSSSNANIMLNSEYSAKENVSLIRSLEGFSINVLNSYYGVYINGSKVSDTTVIKNNDFLAIADYSFYFDGDTMWTQARPELRINYISYQDFPNPNNYPVFKRNTRIKYKLNDEKISILDPPDKVQKNRNNLIMKLLPSLGMLSTSFLMAFIGGYMIWVSLISGTISIVTAVYSIVNQNKEFKQKTRERIEQYNQYIGNKCNQIDKFRKKELNLLENIYISQQKEMNLYTNFSSDLFERTSDDEDFLAIRLGVGRAKAVKEIDYKKKEKLDIDDDLQKLPETICKDYEYINNAPIVCSLKDSNAVGFFGAEHDRYEIFKNIVIDLCARQYYSDLKLYFVADKGNKHRISELKYLPYVYNQETGLRSIVTDDDSKNLMFEYLYNELTNRKNAKGFAYRIIVFFYDKYGFENHPISKFVSEAKDLGITFVFFENQKSDIPQGCDYLVELIGNKGKLIDVTDIEASQNFEYSYIRAEDFSKVIHILAPVYTQEISLEGSLTKNISLFELLGIFAVEDINLDSNWKNSKVEKSMAAPIGVSKTNMISLDLHDKAHGPHGLVAGTTGSGKSEVLQTYILSAATLYHPYEVAFVIIDFKGGGMVNQFSKLPHLLGAITNIDGKEIDRSLKSIKAELKKRQQYFAKAEVNHIDKYIKKFKAGEVKNPLPHLILIVDEFAELKAEQPEFMKELISAARIGRSLGVHLILATQKPSGQVNEQIWSNSRFKICLKVQGPEDSKEMLKSPLAAEIKEPGRAYLQVGNNEIFELFQSAYSGAPEKIDEGNSREFKINAVSDTGKRTTIFEQKKSKKSVGSSTQLDAVVKHVSKFCENINHRQLPNICLPPLSELIEFKSSIAKDYKIDLGVYDDPDNQYQGKYSIDISENNLMIIGSSQSGKTNLLNSIIRSLSTAYTPKEVMIYVMDFASMTLKIFENLNHVGGVVTSSEDEKLKNLFKLLHSEVEKRKEKFVSVGVSSFKAFKETGEVMPLIVLLIDNLTVLREILQQNDEEMLWLCRESLSVGISIVIANSQTAGIGYKYLSNFSTKLALFCNDTNEYRTIFESCRERINNIPGRAIIELDKEHYEAQTFLSFGGEKEIDRANEIRKYIAETNNKNKNIKARVIPVIPSVIEYSYIKDNFLSYMKKPFDVVVGLNYETVEPVVLDFSAVNLLAVTGREKSGRHNFTKYVLSIISKMFDEKMNVYVVDSIDKKLSSIKEKTHAYSIVAEEAVTYVKEIEQIAKSRYEAVVSGDEKTLENSELLLLVIDNSDALDLICKDRESLEAYKNIIGRYKNMNVAIIVHVTNANIPFSANEILKNIKDQKHLMCFEDVANIKIVDIPFAQTRSFKKQIDLGDSYYINEGELVKIKTINSDNIL